MSDAIRRLILERRGVTKFSRVRDRPYAAVNASSVVARALSGPVFRRPDQLGRFCDCRDLISPNCGGIALGCFPMPTTGSSCSACFWRFCRGLDRRRRRSYIKAYLSNPWVVCFFPLIVGVAILLWVYPSITIRGSMMPRHFRGDVSGDRVRAVSPGDDPGVSRSCRQHRGCDLLGADNALRQFRSSSRSRPWSRVRL